MGKIIGYKNYWIVLYDEDIGVDIGPDYKSKESALKSARHFVEEGVMGAAVIDSDRDSVIASFGDFPDLDKVFVPGSVVDERKKRGGCCQNS